MSFSQRFLLVGLFAMLYSLDVDATTYTSISDGSYNDCSIWDNGCPPNQITVGDTVIINHNVDASSSMEVYGVLIVNVPGDFSCDNDISLEESGRIDVSGNFTLLAELNLNGYLRKSKYFIFKK